jgi:hypothetical protein
MPLHQRAAGDVPDDVSLALCRWYATALAWRPKQLALFVHDTTLLPVLIPLAPAATVLAGSPTASPILELHELTAEEARRGAQCPNRAHAASQAAARHAVPPSGLSGAVFRP